MEGGLGWGMYASVLFQDIDFLWVMLIIWLFLATTKKGEDGKLS